MKKSTRLWQHPAAGLGVIMLALVGCATSIPPAPCQSSLAAPGPEQIFATPEQAANALAEANRSGDKTALLKILGMQGSKIISSGDPVADKESRDSFVAAYDKAHSIEDGDHGRKTLVVGDEEWPLPIPLVHVMAADKVVGGWQFDTSAGEQEILNRRIGRDEIYAIQIVRIYVQAQHEFADQHYLPNGESEYARHFLSRKGKHDGLYWPVKAGEAESPLGPLVADARAEGYGIGHTHPKRHPYHGYYYKILTAQGDNASGGAQNYIHNGHMTGGFALIAFPDKYGDTGIMTFIVNQNGIVFQKNLGPDTLRYADQITAYDPDSSWSITTLTP